MDEIYRLLFSLLRKEICGETFPFDASSITDEQYSILYKISKHHDIAHIIGVAIETLNLKTAGGIEKQFQKTRMMAVYRGTQMSYELEQLATALEKAKIAFMPLKGSIIRQYYADPNMRTSCDIDIYIKEADLEKATFVLTKNLGYQLGRKDVYEVSFYTSSDVHIELHFALTEKTNKIFENIWDTATKMEGTEHYYRMTNEMFLVYHIVHMAKHFVYGGCGIKPFMDLWIAKNKMGYNLAVSKHMLNECGLLVFAEAVLRLSEVWFSNAEHTQLTKEMQEYIIGAGAYGTMENHVAIAQARRGGKIKYALTRIFQPYTLLKVYYPRLEKYPFLFPYYQVKRWCRIVFSNDKKRAVQELKYNQIISTEKKNKLMTLCKNLELI